MLNRHIVAISGGKDSTAMALRLKELYPDRPFEFVITVTGDELPEMETHWLKLEERLGQKFHRIFEISLLDLIREQKMIPNFRARFCTRILKIEPFFDYVGSLEGKIFWYSGIRADEEEREGIVHEVKNIEILYPLKEWGWTLQNVVDYLAYHNIQIPQRTDCGACFFQRLEEWKRLSEVYPERYAEYEALEEEMGHTFRTPGKDTWSTSLKDLRKEFESGRVPRAFTGRSKSLKCSWCSR